ncbi:MAG: hypothetical protein R3199_08605 [Gemmatimonadota bacterium]|nr:hypothetical protein [Gemmatimonadota bacterium]
MLIPCAEGPTRRPRAERWPLDAVLVGVGALRVARTLYHPYRSPGGSVRPYELPLWCGVTAPGARKVLDRFHEAGLVDRFEPYRPDRAPSYRPVRDHPMRRPLTRLFREEGAWAARLLRERQGEPDTSLTRPGPGR